MLHPSYSELIQAINNNAEEDDSSLQAQNRSYQTLLTRNLFLLLSTNFTKVKLKS